MPLQFHFIFGLADAEIPSLEKPITTAPNQLLKPDYLDNQLLSRIESKIAQLYQTSPHVVRDVIYSTKTVPSHNAAPLLLAEFLYWRFCGRLELNNHVILMSKPFWTTSIETRALEEVLEQGQVVHHSVESRQEAIRNLARNGFSQEQIDTLSLLERQLTPEQVRWRLEVLADIATTTGWSSFGLGGLMFRLRSDADQDRARQQRQKILLHKVSVWLKRNVRASKSLTTLSALAQYSLSGRKALDYGSTTLQDDCSSFRKEVRVELRPLAP